MKLEISKTLLLLDLNSTLYFAAKKTTEDKKENKKSEKTVQMKSSVEKSSAEKIDTSQCKRPCCKKNGMKKDNSKGKYIVSRDYKLEERTDQPFTGFGYGNKNKETAHKMTSNVRAPCDVSPSIACRHITSLPQIQ